MLELLHAIAYRMAALRPLALLALVAGLAGFVAAVVTGATDRALAAALLVAIWGGWWFTLLAAFRRAPPVPARHTNLRGRFRTRLSRAGYLTIAWLLLASGVAAAFLSVRLLTLDPLP